MLQNTIQIIQNIIISISDYLNSQRFDEVLPSDIVFDVTIVRRSIDQLPAAFAQLEGENREAKRSALPLPHAFVPTTRAETETASLPAADRPIVRARCMSERIRRASRSRAPRSGGNTG